MIKSNSKRILVIGATSKIAEQFIRLSSESYEIYGTHNSRQSDLLPASNQFQLDLGDNGQIKLFLKKVTEIKFDAVLFFAATYTPDSGKNDDYLVAYQKDLQCNAMSIMAIAKGLTFADHSKLFVFGDAGLAHPKKGFTAYSMSKFAVADVARMLAVELAPQTATFCLRLGPTLKEDTLLMGSDYYGRGLLEIDKPVEGLLHLLQFLIAEPNFNATGCVIDYDGGAYIKRLT